jgi:hypothetical protein
MGDASAFAVVPQAAIQNKRGCPLRPAAKRQTGSSRDLQSALLLRWYMYNQVPIFHGSLVLSWSK